MGKKSWIRRVDEEDEDGDHQSYNRWKRFINALHYHQWQYKILHRSLLDGKRQHKNKAKSVLNEESHLQVKKTGLNNKRSLRARIKAFIVDQSHEGKNNKQDDEEIIDKEKSYILKEDEDVEELALKVLQDAEAGSGKLPHDQMDSSRKTRLTKCGSFPVNDSYKPLKLKDKQNEVWSYPKVVAMKKYAKYLLKSLDLLADEDDKDNLHRSSYVHRRSSSLNESLDRYSRLFDHSFGKEIKLKASKSLKVPNERVMPPIPLRRIHSLSSVDPSYFLPNYHDMEGLEHEVDELKLVKDNLCREHGMEFSEAAASNDLIHSHFDSILQPCFQEKKSTLADYQISKGSEDTQNSAKESDFVTQKFTKDEKANMMDDPDLCYVMDILNSSSFTKNFFQEPWYSSNQPLNPTVFDEVEAFWHKEEQCSTEEGHHQMLFDLLNEVCVEIYERCFTYYPAALSSSCRIRSLPTGNHIIEEIFSSIRSWLNLKPEVKQSLNCILSRDLEKDYGWMNLQLESEDVALELEDMLFDNLLDELLIP